MKISQERLAELAGLHTNTVRRLEAVQYDPALSTLLKLARALRVRPAALLKDIR
jgi:transcriptional regulator with XRE-family HTH domain